MINIGHTVDASHPVWSPIDTGQYESYLQGKKDVKVTDALAKQVLDLLYTVRNNAFHGGKSPTTLATAKSWSEPYHC